LYIIDKILSFFVLYANNSDRFCFITGDLLLLISGDLHLPKNAAFVLTDFFKHEKIVYHSAF